METNDNKTATLFTARSTENAMTFLRAFGRKAQSFRFGI